MDVLPPEPVFLTSMLSDESPLAEGICSVGLVCVSFHSTSKTTWECASVAFLLKAPHSLSHLLLL